MEFHEELRKKMENTNTSYNKRTRYQDNKSDSSEIICEEEKRTDLGHEDDIQEELKEVSLTSRQKNSCQKKVTQNKRGIG